VASLFCAAQKKRPKLLADIPFIPFVGGVIAIEAKLDTSSQPLTFILDTGSGGISLDSATCSHLHLSPRLTDTVVTGIAGKRRVSYVFNKTLMIDTLKITGLNMHISDYSDVSSIYGQKIDGIIGYSFFNRFIVQVNFDTSRIKIFAPGRMDYGNKGTLLSPAFNSLIMQRATVRDHRKVSFPFYMDTGAGLCILLSKKFQEDSTIISPKRRPVIIQAEGLGGKKLMELTVVRQVKIGPYKFRNVPAYLYDDEQNITAYPFTGGLIGNDLMRRFNLTFNYGEKEMYIEPNTHYFDEFDYAYTGLSIYDVNDGIFVEDIVENSPAAKAGLLLNDEIISINSNFSGKIGQYANLLQKAKEKVEIIVRRKGQLQIIALYPISILR
jgi:hypothetical protein